MFCSDCELVALLEDDTGMELLVCNKIVSLDLPVKDVFKKIWCAHSNVRAVHNSIGTWGYSGTHVLLGKYLYNPSTIW